MSVIFRDRSNPLNFHQLLKSRSNNRCRESFSLHTHDTFKEEEDEFAATLKKAESLDHNNCMWLSSGDASSSSPSSCFHDNKLSDYTDVKIDAWFISLLSTTPSTRSCDILSTKATFFDGSIANPIEEASLVLDQRKEFDKNVFFHENLEEKEVVSWLANDQTSSCISSITDSSDHEHSFSSCSTSEYSSEVVDLEEIGKNKPLFWPSDWTSDWDSETKCDLFIMSPRKNTYKFDSDKGNRRLQFDTNFDLKNTNNINDFKKIRNKPSRFKKPTKTNAKIVPLDNETNFESLTEAKVFNESGPTNTRTKTKTPVSWLSECASEWGSDAKWDLFVMSPRKDDLRLQVLNGKMDLDKGCSRKLEFTEVKPLTMKSVSKHRIVLEDLLLVDKLNVEGAIEEALGLDEFDGLEGLGSEFNKDGFSLVEIF